MDFTRYSKYGVARLKGLFPALTLLFAFVLLTGMGSVPHGETPVPDAEFSATVVDSSGMVTKCTTVSLEGKTFVTAKRGKGIITIPFAKVKRVEFLGTTVEKNMEAQVTLKSGEVIAVTFDADLRFFGNTSFGAYWISSKNIKEITFN